VNFKRRRREEAINRTGIIGDVTARGRNAGEPSATEKPEAVEPEWVSKMGGGEEKARSVTEKESEMRGRRKPLSLLVGDQSTHFLERTVCAS
jgi:hypothetical protein